MRTKIILTLFLLMTLTLTACGNTEKQNIENDLLINEEEVIESTEVFVEDTKEETTTEEVLEENLPIINVELDNNTTEWNGEENDPENNFSEEENEILPGFSDTVVSSESKTISLYNPKGNKLNLIYEIIKPLNNEKVMEFNSYEEASNYLSEQTILYSNFYDESTNTYQVKDESGNVSKTFVEFIAAEENDKYVVYKNEYEMIFFTQGIEENKAIEWNAYDELGLGEHTLQIRITSYNKETNREDYGRIYTTKITVEEKGA